MNLRPLEMLIFPDQKVAEWFQIGTGSDTSSLLVEKGVLADTIGVTENHCFPHVVNMNLYYWLLNCRL